ncbi:group 1 truncated hemoglobin [Nocardia sp. NPDC058658]|uniref:group I truncated hemoglobin n=1 Tax=Nocardia sp. NPDC058658 TaxID=3346580 RepID=UPI0036547CB9
MTSIYEQIGGEAALVAVVDDLYERIMADEVLRGYFAEVDSDRIIKQQVAFFAEALGGPAGYTGKAMRAAHAGLGISQDDFDRVAGHLVAALTAAGVPDEVVCEIIGAVAALAGEIVSVRNA